VERPLHAAYNAVVHGRSSRSVTLRDIRRTFRTPTGTIREHVESFAGEEGVLAEVISTLRSDDCFWDVGASFGLYALFASDIIASPGAVHAFEPEPRMRRLLERNATLNNAVSITVHPFALGDQDGMALLYRSATPNVGTSALVQRRDYRLKRRGIAVPLRRGDHVAGDGTAAPPTVLKIDVEGGEGRVIAGLGKVLTHPGLRLIVCEVHPHLLPSFGDSVAALEAMIAEAGFTIHERIPRGTEYHLLCRRKR
jgi:FkbM family methyltransferase